MCSGGNIESFLLGSALRKISEIFYRENWHPRYKMVTSSCLSISPRPKKPLVFQHQKANYNSIYNATLNFCPKDMFMGLQRYLIAALQLRIKNTFKRKLMEGRKPFYLSSDQLNQQIWNIKDLCRAWCIITSFSLKHAINTVGICPLIHPLI